MADERQAIDRDQGAKPIPRVVIPPANIDGLLVLLIRRWRWILGTTVAFGLGVLLALPFLPSSYEISANLLVKLGREQTAPPVASSPSQSAPYKRSEDVASELEILGSQALVERLVNDLGVEFFLTEPTPRTLFQHLKAFARSVARTIRAAWSEVLIFVGLEKRLTPFERIVSTLNQSLSTEAVKRSDVIKVTLLATDPSAGIHVLRRLLELYQDEHIRVFKTPGATAFLASRVEALRAELAAVETRRRAFGEQGAVWDYEQQQRQLLERRGEAQQVLSRTLDQRRQVAAEIEQAEAVLSGPEPERLTQRVEQVNPAVQALQARILERRAMLATLRLAFAADSERVRDEEAQLHELEALLQRTEKSVTLSQTFETRAARVDLDRGLSEKRNRLAGLDALADSQRRDLQQVEDAVHRLDAAGEKARALQRDAAVAEQSYRLFIQRLDEARILDALDAAQISNVALIGEPVSSVRPVRPRAMLLFLAALGAGLLSSMAFILLRDAMRPVVHSRDRVAEALGVPVLVRLPEVRK